MGRGYEVVTADWRLGDPKYTIYIEHIAFSVHERDCAALFVRAMFNLIKWSKVIEEALETLIIVIDLKVSGYQEFKG